MKLTTDLIDALRVSAEAHEDDRFFCVRSREGEFFLFNWTLGLRFRRDEIYNSNELENLEAETDRICARSEKHKDIIRHIYLRGWMDILVGTGLYQDAHLTKLHEDEHAIFTDHGWRVLPFETDNGRRFYVKEAYFDVAEKAIGHDISPVIFRPINSEAYPREYRPMLFQDETGDVRGLVRAISEEDIRDPVDQVEKYVRVIEEMPEYRGRSRA